MINKILSALNRCSYEKSDAVEPKREKKPIIIRLIPTVRRVRYVKIIF